MSPPSVRSQLAGKKRRVISRLVPDMLEVAPRRKYVLIVWLASMAGLIGLNLVPPLIQAYQQGLAWDDIHFPVQWWMVGFAAVVSLLYAALTESKGAHEGDAGKARLDRLLKEGVAKLVMAGSGLLAWLAAMFGGGQ